MQKRGIKHLMTPSGSEYSIKVVYILTQMGRQMGDKERSHSEGPSQLHVSEIYAYKREDEK